jgi:diguanylate cyclase (GGDEF)-like protein
MESMLLIVSLLAIAGGFGLWRRYRAMRTRIQALEEQARWYHDALRIAGAGVWQWDIRNNEWKWIEDVFQARGSSLSYKIAMGDQFKERVHPDDRGRLQRVEADCAAGIRSSLCDDYRYRREDGEERWLRDIGHLVSSDGGAPTHMVGITIDITHEKQRALDDLARSSHDDLTGLPNRRRLMQMLSESCNRTSSFSLAFIDLNGFKLLNDRHGHAAGDRCLADIGTALTALCSEGEFCARLGGDEFVIVVPSQATNALPAVRRITEIVHAALDRADRSAEHVRIGAAVGVAHYPDHGTDPETLLAAADAAMYAAKGSRRRVTVEVARPHVSARRLSA